MEIHYDVQSRHRIIQDKGTSRTIVGKVINQIVVNQRYLVNVSVKYIQEKPLKETIFYVEVEKTRYRNRNLVTIIAPAFFMVVTDLKLK